VLGVDLEDYITRIKIKEEKIYRNRPTRIWTDNEHGDDNNWRHDPGLCPRNLKWSSFMQMHLEKQTLKKAVQLVSSLELQFCVADSIQTG
jgi:hypothetical protein